MAGLHRVLTDYISASAVERAIAFACRDLGHTPEDIPDELHAALVEQVMLRARTFADPETLTDMMLRVAELFESEQHEVDPEDALSILPPESRPPAQTQLQVLVVDDDAISRRVVTAMLEASGAQVTSVESGQQAVDLLDEGDFDVVCMDCYMPGLSGFQATQLIRRAERQRGAAPCRIIAITAQDARQTREHAAHVGIDELLIKPVTRERLTQAVYRVLPSLSPADEDGAAHRVG